MHHQMITSTQAAGRVSISMAGVGRLLIYLLLALGSMPAMVLAGGGGGGDSPDMPMPNEPPNILIYLSSDAEYYGLGHASAAWKLECENAPDVFLGNLIVDAGPDLDAFRCYRVVTGYLQFKGGAADFSNISFVGLPWVERINGNLIVDAGTNLDEVWMSRLQTLQGTLDVDFRTQLEKVALPQMTVLGDVFFIMRSMSNDWTGTDSIVQVGDLVISNPQIDNPSTFGFNGLVQADSLKITGRGVTDNGTGIMTSFTTVLGDVEISIKDADQPFGTQEIQTIGGNLWIHDTDILNLDGFGSLQSVAGCVSFTGTNNQLSSGEMNSLLSQIGQLNNLNPCL